MAPNERVSVPKGVRSANYSVVRRLAILSYGTHKVMRMLKAYMDASGKADNPDQNMLTIGGVVSSLDRWEAFEAEWKRNLADFGVSQLHMKTLSHFKGEYKEWDEHKRRQFIASSISLMKEHCEGYMAGTMPMYVWKQLSTQQQQVLIDAYYPCFLACIIGAAECARHLTPEEKVEVIFADEPGFKGDAVRFYERCRAYDAPEELRKYLASHIVLNADPVEVVPCQAAYLVAYEVNKYLTEGYRRTGRRERWPFTQIKEKMLIIEFFDRRTILERFGF